MVTYAKRFKPNLSKQKIECMYHLFLFNKLLHIILTVDLSSSRSLGPFAYFVAAIIQSITDFMKNLPVYPSNRTYSVTNKLL